MNKQEIIDNLRLELRDRDLVVIDLRAKNKIAANVLEKAKNQLEYWDKNHVYIESFINDELVQEISNTLQELAK